MTTGTGVVWILMVLEQIHDEQLYRALGVSSFDRLVEERLDMAKTSAYQLMAVVQHVPRATAVKLGSSKAYDLVARRWSLRPAPA